MTSYEFGSSLYRNAREMCDAIAENWLSAQGANSRNEMVETLNAMTDEQLADECIEGWGLDQTVEDDFDYTDEGDQIATGRTWMEIRETDRDDLVTAFHVLRDNFDERFPAE